MNANLLYIESQILCIVLMAVLIKFYSHSIEGALKFTGTVGWISMLISASDIFRIMFLENIIACHIFNIIYFSLYGLAGYMWLKFCLCQFDIKSRLVSYIFILPALIVAILSAASVNTGWIYRIDGSGAVVRGSLYYAVMINYIYVAASAVCAVYSARKEKRKRVGREYLLTVSFTTPVFVGLVMNAIFPYGINIMTYAIFSSLLMIYSNLQHKMMITDNLTEMPNRYGMDDEIQEQLRQYARDKNDSFYIIVCDMDNFKTINDSWGHPEGDRALRLIADVLTSVAEQYDSEVFRIGGDEFVVITDTSEFGLADKVCEAIKNALDNIDFRDDFDIKMSMGVSLYDGKCEISELINGADKKLYQAKRKTKEEQ